jgi:hypothetical protein
MKKCCLIALLWALACAATAQKSLLNEAHIMVFRIPDGEKDHFWGGGYYYNFNDRNAIGVRVAYHAEKKSEFYQSQTRYFELSHRWRFQKMDKKIGWSLSTGPWVQIFTSHNSGVFSGDNQWNIIGVVNTAGLHYHIVPRLSVGAVGLAMLEVFSWERGEDPAFYPLITSGIGLQLTYAW